MMQDSRFNHKFISSILAILVLMSLACGTFQVGLEDDEPTPTLDLLGTPGTGIIKVPTSGPDMEATIEVLATQNSQLIIQIETLVAMEMEMETETPTPQNLIVQASLTSTQQVISSTAPVITGTPTITPSMPQPTWQTQSLLAALGEPGPLYILQRQSAPLTGTRILTSIDFGKTWHPFAEELPVVSTCLNNINLDYSTSNALYLSTCQGLFRWSGEAWDLVSPKETGSVAIVYNHPETIWATEPVGPAEVPVLRSDNAGVTWSSASRYLGHSNGVANLVFDSQNNQILYATIWPDYAGSYLRRGATNGQWEDLPTPANNAPLGPGLAVDGNSGALYVVANPSGSQLWRTDQPAVPESHTIQWKLIRDFGAWVRVDLLASGWGPDGLALYANLSDLSQNGKPILHRSLDGGKTWTPLVARF